MQTNMWNKHTHHQMLEVQVSPDKHQNNWWQNKSTKASHKGGLQSSSLENTNKFKTFIVKSRHAVIMGFYRKCFFFLVYRFKINTMRTWDFHKKHQFGSLRVRVENLDMNGWIVTSTGHGLPGLIGILRLQVVHELHRGGVGSQLQRSLTAGLQLEGYVDGPVYSEAQAVHADLPVTAAVQELLTARQLSPEIGFHVDVDVVPPLRKLPGEALPQGVLHWIHLHRRGGGLCVRRVGLRNGGHPQVSWFRHVSLQETQ